MSTIERAHETASVLKTFLAENHAKKLNEEQVIKQIVADYARRIYDATERCYEAIRNGDTDEARRELISVTAMGGVIESYLRHMPAIEKEVSYHWRRIRKHVEALRSFIHDVANA